MCGAWMDFVLYVQEAHEMANDVQQAVADQPGQDVIPKLHQKMNEKLIYQQMK